MNYKYTHSQLLELSFKIEEELKTNHNDGSMLVDSMRFKNLIDDFLLVHEQLNEMKQKVIALVHTAIGEQSAE